MFLYLYKIQLHLPKMLTGLLPTFAKGNKRFMDPHSEIEYNKIDLVVELVVHCIDIFISLIFLLRSSAPEIPNALYKILSNKISFMSKLLKFANKNTLLI